MLFCYMLYTTIFNRYLVIFKTLKVLSAVKVAYYVQVRYTLHNNKHVTRM